MPRVRAPLRHHRTSPKDVPASVPVAALSPRPRSHRIFHVMRNARNAWQLFDTKENCADYVGRRGASPGSDEGSGRDLSVSKKITEERRLGKECVSTG